MPKASGQLLLGLCQVPRWVMTCAAGAMIVCLVNDTLTILLTLACMTVGFCWQNGQMYSHSLQTLISNVWLYVALASSKRV